MRLKWAVEHSQAVICVSSIPAAALGAIPKNWNGFNPSSFKPLFIQWKTLFIQTGSPKGCPHTNDSIRNNGVPKR